MTPDRLEELRAQTVVTGIDFVDVHPDQTTLDVLFLSPPGGLDVPLVGDLAAAQISIERRGGGDGAPRVPVDAVAWAVVDGRDALRLTLPFAGGFALYVLTIDDARIDPYFNGFVFSFKAACPSDLDCAPRPPFCPPDDEVDAPIDYLARDFWSLRRALLDFAALRYPDWQDRLEADAGIMLAEVMAALGDELAYHQDRVARQAHLETATERRSLKRLAQLVDYTVHDGLAAGAWLDVTVEPGGAGALAAGTDVWAVGDGGERIDFEVGRGLGEVAAGVTYAVDAVRNALAPHLWDEDDLCLAPGATAIWVEGHRAADLPLDDAAPGKAPGRWVLLASDPASPGEPARRWPVRVIAVEEGSDPLITHPDFGNDVSRLVWEEEQALPFQLDLAATVVRGNLVPATAGRTERQRFVLGLDPDDPLLALPALEQAALVRAVERTGAEGSTAYLASLPGSVETEVSWVGPEPRTATPEVLVREQTWNGAAWVDGVAWEWRRSFVGVASSQPQDRHFVLDDGTWERVIGFHRTGGEIVHRDYSTGAGKTVRFGDGELGRVPPAGTVIEVRYRLGNGRQGNLPAGSLTFLDAAAAPFVEAVTNPLAAAGGADAETPVEVRQLAPEAFRAVTYRAVRPEDYAEAVERLPWVDRAGAVMRWTGSWPTVFATPDPRGSVEVTADQRGELARQLDRFRQAGREAHPADPRYADLDLEITVCVSPAAYRGEVKEAVLERLLGRPERGEAGFFAPDSFTFGTPLARSRVEAAVQSIPGVCSVGPMRVRRRGRFGWRAFTQPYLAVGDREVIRLENDPTHPDRGSLRLVMEGGA